jgi:beta-glucanase (GH16 family)
MRISALLIMALAGLNINAAEKAGWKLVWADEFNGAGLVDETIWNYEKGFVRNKEAQYYTEKRPENVVMRDGNLVITARKEDFKENGKESKYTSGSIKTKGKKDFKYGRIEVRAKLPIGQGNWPAIWMMGIEGGWPKCGEIDIMEHVWAQSNTVHATVHWSDPVKGKKDRNGHTMKGSKLQDQKPYLAFHIYAVEWNEKQMKFFYDDTLYFTYDMDLAGTGPENPFRKPHYLLINLAIGGSWGGKIDDAIFPCEYLIDYVRYYTPNP